MRMCDFPADTATGISLLAVSTVCTGVIFGIPKLRKQTRDLPFRRGLRARAQETGQVVHVAAGEAEEGHLFYFVIVSIIMHFSAEFTGTANDIPSS